MKQCPYCGAEIPDDKNAAFCIKCDHIIDDEVFLRQQLKKELEKPKTGNKGKPKSKRNNTPPAAQKSRRYDDNYTPKRYYEEKKSYANFILIAIVVLIVIYVLLK